MEYITIKDEIINEIEIEKSRFICHLKRVDNKEEADIIISDSEDATLKPFDVEEIAAKWL